MPIKPVGLGAGNKFTVADDGSALTGLDAGALVGEVPLANGGLGTDASALADGLVTKSMGLMSTTTEVTATIQGTHQNGVAMSDVGIDEFDNLTVNLANPLSLYGEVITIQPTPRVQIDAAYGILTTDHETLTDGVTGSVTGSTAPLFVCQTGTAAGGYGVLRSRRVVRCRPGQACRLNFSAMFTAGIATSYQLAGGFNATDGMFFGYNGAAFGCGRRDAGAVAIWRLTVTAGTTGAETLTVRLNGTNFSVAAGAGLATDAVARVIAAYSTYTGWASLVSPTANGSTVTFLQSNPAATVGTFTLTSTGTATGTFAELQAGAPNVFGAGWTAQTAWNRDRLDGSNGALNPSGMLLDPTKLNAYAIAYPANGVGMIRFMVATPLSNYVTVHVAPYASLYTVPSVKNPVFRVGWISESLGSTTNLTVSGGSAGATLQGRREIMRDPNGKSEVFTGVTTSELIYFAIRNRAEFASRVNQRQLLPQTGDITVETANRIGRARFLVNPTFTTPPNWRYVAQGSSSVEYATISAGAAFTGGTEVAAKDAVAQSSVNLAALDLRLEPGDVLAVALRTASSTATISTPLNWHED